MNLGQRMFWVAAVCVVCISALGSRSSGGVVFVSRDSSVHIEGQIEEQTVNQTKASDKAGSFDQSLSFAAGEVAKTHGHINVSQKSDALFERDSAWASGSLSAEAFGAFDPQNNTGPLIIHGETLMTLVFQVIDHEEHFNFNGKFSGIGQRGATLSASLESLDPAPPGAGTFGFLATNEQSDGWNTGGLLTPNTYRLTVNVGAGSSGSSPGDPLSAGEQWATDFHLGVGAATAIPLPGAALPGMALLLLAAAIASRRKIWATR